jgi:RNA polymerase sigma-70 factor (ECF subfamily)
MGGRRQEGSTDDDDRRILGRIAAGDRAAFDLFYHAYARRVLAYVRDIVHAPELAEEVASDVMVAVWKSAARYAGRARVVSWVLGVAHHKAIDALRRRGDAFVPLDDVVERTDATDSPEATFIALEDRARLDDALFALSVEHRAVLQLMYAFGCSQNEIAEIVACPVATVKTRVFYAKKRLREELERMRCAEGSV